MVSVAEGLEPGEIPRIATSSNVDQVMDIGSYGPTLSGVVKSVLAERLLKQLLLPGQ